MRNVSSNCKRGCRKRRRNTNCSEQVGKYQPRKILKPELRLPTHHMDYNRFYKQLFQPIEERIGPIDEATIMAIIGFDCGGPVSLCTVGRGREPFVTYVTCELAVREEQKPAGSGRYEVMMTCDDEDWARKILTKIGQIR